MLFFQLNEDSSATDATDPKKWKLEQREIKGPNKDGVDRLGDPWRRVKRPLNWNICKAQTLDTHSLSAEGLEMDLVM